MKYSILKWLGTGSGAPEEKTGGSHRIQRAGAGCRLAPAPPVVETERNPRAAHQEQNAAQRGRADAHQPLAGCFSRDPAAQDRAGQGRPVPVHAAAQGDVGLRRR